MRRARIGALPAALSILFSGRGGARLEAAPPPGALARISQKALDASAWELWDGEKWLEIQHP